MSEVAAVLLAAGGGARFRSSAARLGVPVTNKLVAPLANATVVQRAYEAMDLGSPAGVPRIVVQGAVVLPSLPGASLLDNPRWEQGQATSLQAALAEAARRGCSGVVVGLGDQPGVGAGAWASLFEAAARGAVVAVATYDGKRRNPVYLHESVWSLVPVEGDEGARALVHGPGMTGITVTEVACVSQPADIDTAEDLLRWS